jgi:2-methylcitrate dehydratase PrpD
MSHHYTRRVAEYIEGARFEDIPGEIVEHIKLMILDTAGVALLGARLPWSEALRRTVEASEAPGAASVWGTDRRFSPPTAAMLNGTAVHGFELDDVGAGGHNGSVTLTSALALAEHGEGLSGAELIGAITTGIEVASRVGRCVGRIPHTEIGFHGPGLTGTFAAAATAGQTLRLSADQSVDLLGHAGQQAASLMFTHHGGMGKRLLAGQAARAGTFGALLAAHGFTNAPNVFEAEFGGFPAAHTGNRGPEAYHLERLIEGLGTDFHSSGVNIKMWACRVPNHPTLEAIKSLRGRTPLAPEDIEHVTIRLAEAPFKNVGWPYVPTTITSAQLNLQYVTAIMLLEDDVFVEQFTEQKIRAPHVLEMVSRVEVLHDTSVGRDVQGNPVEIRLRDGTVLEEWGKVRGGSYAGGDENPVTRDEVVSKFRKMVAAELSVAEQDALIDFCDGLETEPDATRLIALMGRGGAAGGAR